MIRHVNYKKKEATKLYGNLLDISSSFKRRVLIKSLAEFLLHCEYSSCKHGQISVARYRCDCSCCNAHIWPNACTWTESGSVSRRFVAERVRPEAAAGSTGTYATHTVDSAAEKDNCTHGDKLATTNGRDGKRTLSTKR